MSDGLKINLSLPVLSIEEQLAARALNGKCFMGWWDHEGQFISWMPSHLSYMEKLFIIDSLKRRMDYELAKDE